MRVLAGLLILAAVLVAMPGYSVEPAYTGQFGNVEEPALRPYKWLYRGVRALFYHPGDQFVDGNLRVPALGSIQGLRGVRRGAFELGESAYRGSVFAPVPPPGDYKKLRALNLAVEQDMLLRNGSDFLFSWYFYPGQKVIDRNPLEGDTKVEYRKREAREVRRERKAAADARKVINPNESNVKRAQRAYIGKRAEYSNGQKEAYRHNLMQLAR
jgi:hypothetical protein